MGNIDPLLDLAKTINAVLADAGSTNEGGSYGISNDNGKA
ncbi:hypothetical protein GCM10009855_22450 [Gordonia cholesterolivorans]|uniref:Uncharacterized protein n=1 Tax=Gordonia cholesterolivorans TaxID=559625 RepID=A0ABN3HJ95_9ACTN